MNLNRCWWAMVFCYFNYFRIKHWLKLFNKSSNLWPWNKPSLKGLVIFIKANGSNNTFDFTVHLLMVMVQTNPWEFSISFLNSKLSLCEFLVQCWMIAIYSAHLRDVNRQPSCVFGDQDWTSMGLLWLQLEHSSKFPDGIAFTSCSSRSSRWIIRFQNWNMGCSDFCDSSHSSYVNTPA